MANLNKVLLIGNLTREPELKFLQSGTGVCDFGMAMNRKFKKGDQWAEEVAFVDVTAWGKQAELIAERVRKGDPIFVEGRLKFDTWKGNDGKSHSKLSVTCEGFQFLTRGEGGEKSPAQDEPSDKAPF